MTTYLIKTVLCSGIFLALYVWLFENEKMHQFKRFYLLGSLVISFLIPLIEIETERSILPTQIIENTLQLSAIQQVEGNSTNLQPIQPATNYFTKENIFFEIYVLISVVIAIRFFRNLLLIFSRKNNQQFIEYQGIRIALTNDTQTPHSFFSTIFLNKNAYENGEVASEIIEHELAHIRQKHSLDILFFELLFTIVWFNPFLFFYGKLIRLNHEFLADEAVLNKYKNKTKYQYLLLNTIGLNLSTPLTSQFNYSYTKKRFKMMNMQPNKKKAIVLQVAILPFLVIMSLMFGKISFAQQPKIEPKAAIHSQNEASQAIVKEYEQLVKKYMSTFKKDETDRARLEFLFLSMSKEQQEKQEFIMIPPFRPFEKNTPTEAEFEAYKNPKVYGIWMNDKKIKNSDLDKYKASDISLVLVSKLYPNAQKTIGYKYKFQADMMTNEYYEAYRKERLADKKYRLVGSKTYMKKK
ncbi:hypothetical protein GCM10011514_26440 [Emticicia aquatilis]|uniref:Peptidase M56 domain-containing protein n=1 Tax=Emticicia aquatilis TaxID=1537369 RepID=A0A917DQW4_9BACT|nr:M56 family metallopeptidase [Emticicia aquatilis]GGD61159.1 hypothetical protein GCM10011514_26440 [Emticicia aquatilis]